MNIYIYSPIANEDMELFEDAEIPENPDVRPRGPTIHGKPKDLAKGYGHCCDKCYESIFARDVRECKKLAEAGKEAHILACRTRATMEVELLSKKDAFVKAVKKVSANVTAEILAKGITFKGKKSAHKFIHNAITAGIKPSSTLHVEFVNGVINSTVEDVFNKVYNVPKERSNTRSARRAKSAETDETGSFGRVPPIASKKPFRPLESKMKGFKPARKAAFAAKLEFLSPPVGDAEDMEAWLLKMYDLWAEEMDRLENLEQEFELRDDFY